MKRSFVRAFVVTAVALLFLDWLWRGSRFLKATLAKVTEGLFWILNFPWSIRFPLIAIRYEDFWHRAASNSG